jgi:hypothetical protein
MAADRQTCLIIANRKRGCDRHYAQQKQQCRERNGRALFPMPHAAACAIPQVFQNHPLGRHRYIQATE